VVETGSEHLVPYLLKFLLKQRLGALPYPVEESLSHFGMREKVAEIDEKRVSRAAGSTMGSPVKSLRDQLQAMDLEFENRQRLDLEAMGLHRDESKSTIHVEAEEHTSDLEEELTDPELYFGETAVDKFWDFYKSERKLKDLSENAVDIRDPRQAYFQTCKDLKVYPRAKLIIRSNTSPVVDYSNTSLISKSSQAVAQAIKRY
jgi:hypothetical protein